MNLTQAHKLFCYPSLVTYLFLYTRQLFFNGPFNKSNLLILALVYLYETGVAVFLKKSIMYKWKISDYILHHFSLAISMFLYSNYGHNLNLHYVNMQKYCVYVNIAEISSILKTLGYNEKIIIIGRIFTLYNILFLMYYEIIESYNYCNSVTTKKYFALFPIGAFCYHLFIALPSFLKYLKNNLHIIL